MAENEKEEEITEEEIAEIANKELRKRDEEISKLKKELNKIKLLSTADDNEPEPLSREECVKRLSSNGTSNYDYAEAVVNLVDIETAEGRANPLGKNGQEVYNFFKDCLEECDGDKNRFVAIYQAKIGADDKQVAMAYNKRRK